MSGVLAVLERRREHWNPMSWEALEAARTLAAAVGGPLMASAVDAGSSELDSALRNRGVERAWAVRHDLLSSYTADGYTAALEQVVWRATPDYVVFPHTYQVRDFAPKLAARMGRTLISDVTGIRTFEGAPVFVRQLLQGKLNADYSPMGSPPWFVSMQAGSFEPKNVETGSVQIEELTPELGPGAIRTRTEEPFRGSEKTVDLGSAAVIVSVGRGIKERENLPLVEGLAKALGAELAASRPICDSGWLPMERQVGSSGQTVAPKLYLALGISGAIQHVVGMKGSKTVIAVNKDENAPIFEIADYGVVGDLFEIVPALTSAVERLRGAA